MGQLVRWLLRVELWLVIGLISLLLVVFFRSFNVTFSLIEEYKPEQVKTALEASLRDIHIVWLARGRPVGSGNEIPVGQQMMQMNGQGWPVGVGAGVPVSEITDQSCEDVYRALLTDHIPGELLPDQTGASSKPGVVTAQGVQIRSLAVGTVCVYQIGIGQQASYSLLYNSASGEVRAAGSDSAEQKTE
ncbi:hypothetical protein [Hahella ganghwensis]|uniref:hypothetical protein n=1 Tax=Hahella ganghwensis TaxID=286420 RepID=UPI000382DD78|nr:hypothetical protein [Hahella ganghwensis]